MFFMLKSNLVILVLLMIGFAFAVDVDFDCPNEIFVDEEFECEVEVSDGDGVYDVKIDLSSKDDSGDPDGERNSALEVWNDGEWKSGYYYLKEFVEDGNSENIRLKILEEGEWEGVLKLRQGDRLEFFDIELEVVVREAGGEETKEDEGENGENVAKKIVSKKEVEVIVLGDVVGENLTEDGLVYVSKNGRIVDWLPYGFGLFLISVVGILLWERGN